MDASLLYAVPLAASAVLALGLRRANRELSARQVRRRPLPADPEQQPRAALVINPSKFTFPDNAKAIVASVCEAHGWALAVTLETTVDDNGGGQARQALAEDVDIVLACGGDGTVRAVGEALAGTSQTMGILPTGTANVLARNLGVPENDLVAAVHVALTGDDLGLDVGWLSVDGGHEQAFLVMAGVGFDGEIMADAPAELKAQVGHAAYVMSGLRKLNGPRERVRITLDGAPELQRRVRSVLIGNCGTLLPGMTLIPQAKVDDGKLDVLALSPKGIVGWAALAAEVVSQRGHRIVEHFQVTSVRIDLARALPAQLDGEAIGTARRLTARVAPGALQLRVPEPSAPLFTLPEFNLDALNLERLSRENLAALRQNLRENLEQLPGSLVERGRSLTRR